MLLPRVLIIVFSIVFVTACKVRIVVPEGGSVSSDSGAFSCSSGKSCNISVVDLFFDETFRAVPASGYEFSKWKKRDRGFCGNKSEPCRLYTSGFAEYDNLIAFLESDAVFYLQPVFNKAGVTSCSVYAGNTPYCADGRWPTCTVTRKQAFQVTNGMTYDQVVELFGCDGSLASLSSDEYLGVHAAVYQWGDGINITIIVGFGVDEEGGYYGPSPVVGSLSVAGG
jgi:hypothetical protein